MITVIPAYGRDYTSGKAAKADWLAGKDFQIATFGADDGRYTSCADWPNNGKGKIMLRYKRLTQIAVL